MCAALVVLAVPGTASADHVSPTFTVTAALKERATRTLWRVEVQYTIVCNGTSSPLYFGDLSLDEQGGAGESIYLGGTAGPSGTSTAFVRMKNAPRVLRPHLKSACADSKTLHGSAIQDTYGSEVVVPALQCDPDLLAKALREYETAKSFYNAAVQDLRQAHEQLETTLAETAKAKAKQAALKAALKELIALLGEDAAAAASVVAIYVRIGLIINAIVFKVLPKLQESRKAFKEAREDMERGEAWRKRAEASLAAALRQGPCTGDLRAKLDQALDEQRRQAAARALIESWENNGYLYLNPATGEVLDETAALREARRILEGGQRTAQSRVGQAAPRITATRRQMEAAVLKIDVAQRLTDTVRRRILRADAAAERLRMRLRPLIR